MTDPHEDLVEAVARKIDDARWDDHVLSCLERPTHGAVLLARAVLALIAERTKDATPEMLDERTNCERRKEALKELSGQPTRDEYEKTNGENNADWEFAYDCAVRRARAAIAEMEK